MGACRLPCAAAPAAAPGPKTSSGWSAVPILEPHLDCPRTVAPTHLRRSESLLEQCSAPNPSPGPSPNPSPGPSNGPTQQCIDSFNAMVDSAVCDKGSPMDKCCAAFAALGFCLDDIVAAMEKEPMKYADTLAAM